MKSSGKYSLKERLKLEELYNQYMGLDSRGQNMALAGVLLLLLIIFGLPMSCAKSYLNEKEKNILTHQKSILELQAKLRDYQQLKEQSKKIEDKWKNQSQKSLTEILSDLIQKSSIDQTNVENIRESNPQKVSDQFEEQSVVVRLNRVPLNQLIDLMVKIESYPDRNLKIKKIQQLRPNFANRQLMELGFEVSTINLSKG